jgi:hypothetical protein
VGFVHRIPGSTLVASSLSPLAVPVNGGDVRRRREQLGWTRPQLLKALQSTSDIPMTIGRLAGIEVRSDDLEDPEATAFATALRLELEPADAPIEVDSNGEASVRSDKHRQPVWLREGEVIHYAWMGLRPGDMFKVQGCPRALFAFEFYLKSEREEYVQCVGGKSGHRLRRWFRPERVLSLRGRRLMNGTSSS